MDPIYLLVQVEWVPSELVGHVVQLMSLSGHRRVVRFGILCLEVLVGRCGQHTVYPGLLVFMSGCCKGRSRQLLGVKTIGHLLRRVLADGQRTLDSLGPESSQLILSRSHYLHLRSLLVI